MAKMPDCARRPMLVFWDVARACQLACRHCRASARLAELYRDSPPLRAIRAGEFAGGCGGCDYADLCRGSRARAYAASGNPLAENPACVHQQAGVP